MRNMYINVLFEVVIEPANNVSVKGFSLNIFYRLRIYCDISKSKIIFELYYLTTFLYYSNVK